MAVTTEFKLIAALLALALLIGGAGIGFPLLETVLEAAALGLLAYLIVTRRRLHFNAVSAAALIILAAMILVPLLQLVPLPPAVWRTLPGRRFAVDLDTALGWAVWRPLTFDVESTVRSALRLLAPAAIFFSALILPTVDRVRLLWIVVAFGTASAVLGLVQFGTGGAFTPYSSAHLGYSLGLFVNRNHQAAFILATMPICAALVSIHAHIRQSNHLPVVVLAVAALIVDALSVLATTSRMGLALLPIALGASLLLLFVRPTPRNVLIPTLGSVTALVLFVVVNGGVTRSLSRFSSVSEGRFSFWADVSWALKHYGLAGTGIGTFVPVYASAESLESVGPALVNHAHNEYLEVLLDAGLVGGLLTAVAIGFFVFVAWRMLRRRDESWPLALACIVAITILLIAALVDYPIRMPAVAAAVAVIVSVLLPDRVRRGHGRVLVTRGASGRTRQSNVWLKRGPALVVLASGFVVVLQAGGSAQALIDQRYEDAADWARWSTQARARLATNALVRSDFGDATREADAALRLSPISVPAVRTLGLIAAARGSPRGDELMSISASLGWRDPPTQLWSIEAAERSGEPAKALERAEALFRERAFQAAAFSALARAPAQQRLIAHLATRLAVSPDWRVSMFDSLSDLPDEDLPAVEKLLGALANTATPATPDEVQPLVDALVHRSRLDAAQRIWSASRSGNYLANGGFELTDSQHLPKYWRVDDRDLSSVQVAKTAGQHRRVAQLVSSRSAATLFQKLYLTPGEYTLTYQARVEGGAGAYVEWQLRCAGSRVSQTAAQTIAPGNQWVQVSHVLTVSKRDCPIQRLALRRVRVQDSRPIWLDNVMLR